MNIASSLPDIPSLHPPEAPPSGVGWTQPGEKKPLDLKGYHLSFDDEFDRLDVAPDCGSGHWYAPVHTDIGEARFEPPGAGGPFKILKIGPFGASGSVLAITASRGNDGWRSGLMQTLDPQGRGFAQQYGYFEMRAKFPNGRATWPSFWLLTRNNLVDRSLPHGEIDVVEQYGSAPDKIHTSVHLWPAPARNAGGLAQHWYRSEKILVGDMASAYHRYGMMLTPQWVIVYYDGLQLSRFPMLDRYRTPVYMLVDLTMHEKDLSSAKSPSTMLVDYVRAYSP